MVCVCVLLCVGVGGLMATIHLIFQVTISRIYLPLVSTGLVCSLRHGNLDGMMGYFKTTLTYNTKTIMFRHLIQCSFPCLQLWVTLRHCSFWLLLSGSSLGAYSSLPDRLELVQFPRRSLGTSYFRGFQESAIDKSP